MAEFKHIIEDALDILKFDGAVQDTLARLREKWGPQVPAEPLGGAAGAGQPDLRLSRPPA